VSYVRIWTTRLDLSRLDEYERFVEERSTPMFQAQRGFRGVLYTRRRDEVAVLSFWEDDAAVDALETSATYRHAVGAISEAGFLIGESVVEVYEIQAGFLDEGLPAVGRQVASN
jgi:heme-degrading monooxygenase HmoA